MGRTLWNLETYDLPSVDLFLYVHSLNHLNCRSVHIVSLGARRLVSFQKENNNVFRIGKGLGKEILGKFLTKW